MADVFLSYAREDLQRALRLVSEFERRSWSVFWDRRIPHGKDYVMHIQEQLDTARCIVVLWSKTSVASQFVRDEAAEGAQGRLVPALIDNVRQPLGFRQIQAADISAWDGGSAHEEVERLMQSIGAIIDASRTSEGGGAPSSPSQAQPESKGDQRPVFLSYVEGDDDEAVRIKDALEHTGLKVWLPTRGKGDTSVNETRQRIADSSLFIAVISSKLQTTIESRFFLECNEAEMQTKSPRLNSPYVVPVVVDDTSPADDRLPPFLKKLEWTSAPGGELGPGILAGIKSIYRRRQ